MSSFCQSQEGCRNCTSFVPLLRFWDLDQGVDFRGLELGYNCLDGSEPKRFLNFSIKGRNESKYIPINEEDCTINNSRDDSKWSGSQTVRFSDYGDIIALTRWAWNQAGGFTNKIPCQVYYMGDEGPLPGVCPYPCAPEGTPGAWNHPVPTEDYSQSYSYNETLKQSFACSSKTTQNPYSQIQISTQQKYEPCSTTVSNAQNPAENGTYPCSYTAGNLVLQGSTGCTESKGSFEQSDGSYKTESIVTLSNELKLEVIKGYAANSLSTKWEIRKNNKPINCNQDKCSVPWLTDPLDLSTLQQYTGKDACWGTSDWNNFLVPNLATYPLVPSRRIFRIAIGKKAFDDFVTRYSFKKIKGKVYMYVPLFQYDGTSPCNCEGKDNFTGQIFEEIDFSLQQDEIMWGFKEEYSSYFVDLGVEVTGEGDQAAFAGQTVNLCYVITGLEVGE